MTRNPLELFEKIVAGVAIVAFSGTIFPVIATGGDVLAADPSEHSGVMVVYAALYVVIMGMICLRQRVALRLPFISPAVSALLVLAFASCLWSIEPEITLRRSVAFLFTTAFGLYLALRWPLADIIKLFAVTLSILTLTSIALALAVPSIGVDHTLHEGAWKGVYFQKNVTGRATVWMMLCLMWLHWQGYGPRWVIRGMLAAGALLLLMCGSGTALLTTIMSAGVLAALRWVRIDVRTLIPAAALLALLALATALATTVFYEDVMAMLGRDPTLTGRTELWEHTLTSIQERFVLGWGYAAYWYGDYGPAAIFTVGWGIASAHNGVIEVLLDLGVPGLVLVLWLMGRVLVQGFAAARYGKARAEGAFIVTMACAMTAISLSESIFMERHSINWVILVAGVVTLIRMRQEGHRAVQPAVLPARLRHAR